jgi:hypothetical protein
MLKAYVLTFNSEICPRQKVLELLDTIPAVKNWYAYLPSSIFIISDQTAHVLANALLAKVDGSYYFVSEVPSGVNNGWLPEAAWQFINSPKSSGRWP